MSVRFPSLRARGLGVGLDVPWDGRTGFGSSEEHGEGPTPSLRAFLQRHAGSWAHTFFSWQPRDRSAPRLDDFAPAWDALVAALPPSLPRALHHTALNLASLGPYERSGLLAFTRQLCERYRLQWVNEDVGFWSLDGRAVPYPLPPLLTEGGLAATIANTRECQAALPVPLLLEFPGFSAGASVTVGEMHAYDFFRRLAEGTEAPVTLDVGHLLSYQWWRGRRGRALSEELERLPLEHCFELHLSGCEVVGDAFIDAHHGTLLDEQFELTAQLLERCPNVRAVTWEDPRFDAQGVLGEANLASWRHLQQLVAGWVGPADAPSLETTSAWEVRRHEDLSHLERALGDHLHGVTTTLELDGLPVHHEPAAVEAVHQMILERRYRGTGGLREWFPLTLASWLELHPSDQDLRELVRRFTASPSASAWREHPNARKGQSLEEAFFQFFVAEGVGQREVREDEFLGALVRALAVAPRADFHLPAQLRRTELGCVAVSERLTLHAAVGGQYVRGPLTPMLASLVRGVAVAEVAERFGAAPWEVAMVQQNLVSRGLIESESASLTTAKG